jgi:hypothetical protein
LEVAIAIAIVVIVVDVVNDQVRPSDKEVAQGEDIYK